MSSERSPSSMLVRGEAIDARPTTLLRSVIGCQTSVWADHLLFGRLVLSGREAGIYSQTGQLAFVPPMLLTQQGRCVKASVCHNNAADDRGKVTSDTFLEEVKLRENCLTESGIEEKCRLAHDRENAGLKRLAEQLHTEYQKSIRKYVANCVPSLWQESCEKACIEAMDAGCGVVEAGAPGNVFAQEFGHLAVQCKPPVPPWIMSAYAQHKETEQEQCARIRRHQQPAYAIRYLRSMVLKKKSRYYGLYRIAHLGGGWKTRHFVLESGNAVRSGVLRYFLTNGRGSFSERVNKTIILRDVEAVEKVQEAEIYGKCFKLKHIKREYELCVTRYQRRISPSGERDGWIDALNSQISRFDEMSN
eukprot:TRINITY_DN111784_c0_g1_i1.p1 TRINITY_DN111784_c0_g1~~TRINITY_DN111784_c0_g1_i1.p1  ORF type:complete len:361 (-),score=37.87 TRINITY_DN111784_c0_g1_i1:67-1149(-)